MQMPEKVSKEEFGSPNHARFVMQPLEPGFGVTIGNAFRRVLLSSITGSSIIGVKISDVLHEYQTITGVVEDMSEIILNLKEVNVRLINEDLKSVHLQVRGPGVFTAKDIQEVSSELEISNPDCHIATLDDDADFEVELRFGSGKGYVPSEEQQINDFPIGMLPIDAIYTPIQNVIYNIEPFRVGQRTDYESLVLDVRTNGTVSAEKAVYKSAHILVDHINYFVKADEVLKIEETSYDTEIEEHKAEMNKVRELLDIEVDDMEVTVRVHNCLKAANIKRIADLVRYQEAELIKFRNFGKKSLNELVQKIHEMGLEFGMNVDQYYKYEKK
jgi:DNA-directed RNA polymerase subunit alpha